MSSAKHFVTIKGVKDGLVFLLDDSCDFDTLIEELNHKLEKTHQQILSGPIIHVEVKLGKRDVTDEQRHQIQHAIGRHGNLLIQSIESEADVFKAKAAALHNLKVVKGMVRSGQTLRHEGNLLFIGDINPGGTVTCTGDIYIMGSLRGMAHAGIDGNEESVIAASYLRPTQLRIAEVISRPPDEWGIEEAHMEFAYLREGSMEIDKLAHLHRIRPGSMQFIGE